MQTTYISSTVALRSKGSLSFSVNDYCFLNERVEKNSYSSCACCAFSIHRVPINPRFLYGLRQSTLIQWSASRRLILGGLDRYCRLPVNDLDRFCHGDSYSLKERRTSSRRRRGRREGRFGCMVWEEKSESCDSGIEGNAEAMLSLLTEDIGEKFVGVGERNSRLAAGGVRVEKRGRVVSECSREEGKYVKSDSLERNRKGELGSVTIKSREEGYRRLGGREGSLRGDDHGLRKEGSSCSSYYSVLSSGDIDESDVDFKFKHGRFIGESESSYKNRESRRGGEGVFEGEVTKQFKKYEDDVEGYGEVSTQGKTALGSGAMAIGVDWDSRKEAEKKLTEVAVGQIESRKESSQNLSKFLEIHESGAERASSSQKQFSGREENSTADMNSVEKTREQFRQTGQRVIQKSGSRRKSQQLTERSEFHGSDIERASNSQKRFSGREENLTASVNLIQEARERHSLTGHQIIGQNESRRESQQVTEMSEMHDSDMEKATSQKLFETRMKNREENSSSLLRSVQEAKERHTQTNQQVGRTESRKESQDLTSMSVIRSSDTETLTSSQKLFEKRMSTQEENSTSVMDLVQKARERHRQTGEEVIGQIRSRKESQKPTKLSSFHESSTERASSSQTPLILVQKAREQQIGAWMEEGRNSEVMVTPPSSQFVARGSPRNQKPTSGYTTQETYCETSESSSSALHTHSQGETPAYPHELDGGTRSDEIYMEHSKLFHHDDALDSANRLEESSTQFVGEFVEKLQDEVSTSGILKERRSSQTTSVYGDEQYTRQGSSKHVSEDFQSQVHDLRRSSSGSGTRGPSVEMWDVVGPSSQEPSRTEAPGEVTPTTESAIVRRTSRSLWSIIADIVRLRWGVRSESHSSAVKSGGRSSSNESVGSEAWFSGHEADDNDDENVKRGRRGMPKESRSANQPHLGKAPTRSQEEASEGMSSQDKIIQIEGNTSSSSHTLERDSPHKGVSSTSGEENFGWKEDEKRAQGTPSSIATVDSTLPLPTRRLIRSPPLEEEISENSKVELSSFTEMAEQPIKDRPTEASGTEGKDGELKRRKLQRNKQVLKERFEEWEEAYRFESEQRKVDEMFMREALLEAKKAANTWEVPVGAVLVQHGKIISRGCNLVEELRDSTAHAEMICIREASNILRTWRLAETTLYVTLEPCPMCAGAILQARIDTVVWGAPNKLLGADGSWVRLFPGGDGGSGSDPTNQSAGPVHPFHPKMTIRRGILAMECADVMQQFFQLRRRKKEKKPETAPPPPPPSCLPISTHPSKFLSKMQGMFSIMFCL